MGETLKRIVVSGVIAAATMGGIVGCGEDSAEQAPQSPPPQSLNAEQADQVFAASLTRLGIDPAVNGTSEQTILLAKQVCEDALSGTAASEVVGRTSASLPPLSYQQAAQFVGVSVTAYCPSQDERFRSELGG